MLLLSPKHPTKSKMFAARPGTCTNKDWVSTPSKSSKPQISDFGYYLDTFKARGKKENVR
jgi:hypothetical protein